MEISACCRRELILSTPASSAGCKADQSATTAACVASSSAAGSATSLALRANSEPPSRLAMRVALVGFSGCAMVISTSASATLAVSCSDKKACRRLRRMSRQTRAKPAPIRMPLRTRMMPEVMNQHPIAAPQRKDLRHGPRRTAAWRLRQALLALPRLLHLHAPRLDKTVHILNHRTLQEAKGIVRRRRRPEGRLCQCRSDNLAPIEAGLDSLPLLEGNSGRDLQLNVVGLGLTFEFATDVVRIKPHFNLGIGDGFGQHPPIELQIRAAACVAPGPGQFRLRHDLAEELLTPGFCDGAGYLPAVRLVIVQGRANGDGTGRAQLAFALFLRRFPCRGRGLRRLGIRLPSQQHSKRENGTSQGAALSIAMHGLSRATSVAVVAEQGPGNMTCL